jgi:hypothetical protein
MYNETVWEKNTHTHTIFCQFMFELWHAKCKTIRVTLLINKYTQTYLSKSADKWIHTNTKWREKCETEIQDHPLLQIEAFVGRDESVHTLLQFDRFIMKLAPTQCGVSHYCLLHLQANKHPKELKSDVIGRWNFLNFFVGVSECVQS